MTGEFETENDVAWNLRVLVHGFNTESNNTPKLSQTIFYFFFNILQRVSRNYVWIVALGIIQPSVLLLVGDFFLAAPDQFIASTTHIQQIPLTFANRTTTNFSSISSRRRKEMDSTLVRICLWFYVIFLSFWVYQFGPNHPHNDTLWLELCVKQKKKIRENVAQTLELSQDRNVFDRLKMKRKSEKNEKNQ